MQPPSPTPEPSQETISSAGERSSDMDHGISVGQTAHRPSFDPTVLKDWEIAEQAEAYMKPVMQLGNEWGLEDDEILPFGRQLAKVDYPRVMKRLKGRPTGKYIDVTAITPTPLGEGKTTTVIGLVEGLAHLGQRVSGAIRQPSGGPTFNIKGSAAGGGLAQCIPLAPLSLGFTGDIDAITNAHNLAMVALCARLQHERNYDDEILARRGLKRLDIDPNRVQLKWVMDFCAQSLRHITIGQGGKMDGYEMDSGFAISVSSELMAILSVARDLQDLRDRIAQIVVAYNRQGSEVTTADLGVDGAMAAWMVKAMNPNLIQTLGGQPVLVHAGPFANIAIGQSSIIADRLAVKLSDYHVTESGFGADIGFEKFWNLKCRLSGLCPDAVVLVATIRALKMHGGGPPVKPGKPLDEAYLREDLALLEKGCDNLVAHLDIVKQSGVQPVVCINHFYTDSEAEVALLRRIAEQHGAYVAVSKHWLQGGPGATELAEAVMAACDKKSQMRFLYETDMGPKTIVKRLARNIYGADDVSYSEKAEKKLKMLAEHAMKYCDYGVCMAKTHLSLSHDPSLKGRPKGWTLPISDILVYQGAKLIVPLAGDIKLMPGTASVPAFTKIDVNTETGHVTGLF